MADSLPQSRSRPYTPLSARPKELLEECLAALRGQRSGDYIDELKIEIQNAIEAPRAAFDRMADIADKSQERAIQAIQQSVELERDAERYRWLRELGPRGEDLCIHASGPGFVTGERFDQVIDKAMEAK